jgi:hypothetical protein
MLSIPFLLLGFGLLAATISELLSAVGTFSVPIAGTALLSLSLSAFLIFGGALGELIYRTGETRIEDFAKVTSKEYPSADQSSQDQLK